MGRAPCCEEGLKKGPWSSQEDNKLLQYILENGTGNWKMLPKQAGLQRCGKSCRLRWTNYLRPGIKRGNFTCEEEQAILQLHCKLGNKWSAIAARLPGRTDNEIKNFWNTRLKKRLLQMGIDPVTHRPHLDLLTPSFSSFFAFQSAQAKLPIQYDNLMSYNMLRSQYKLDEAAANLWAQQHLGDSLIYNAQNLDHHFFQPRFTMTGWNGDIERTQQPNFTTMGYSNYSAMDRASIDASLASCLANDTTTLNPQLGILFDKVGRDQNMSMEKVFYQGEYDQNCNNLLLSTDSEAVNSDLVWPNSLPPLLSYSGSLTPDNSSGTVADTQSDSSPNGYGQPLPSEHFMNIAINNEEGRDYWSNVVNFMDTIPTGP